MKPQLTPDEHKTRVEKLITTVYPPTIAEILKAEYRHGPMTKDLVRGHLLMAEEMGEFAQAVADVSRVHGKWQETAHDGDWGRREPLKLADARTELCQVLAVGLMVLERIIEQEAEDAKLKKRA